MASFIFRIISGSVLILILLMIRCGDTTEPELNCIPSIRVPRNTVWTSSENETLMIKCTVFTEPHCWKNLPVSWCRINDKNECRPMTDSTHFSTAWRNISGSQRMFILIFWNLSKQDAGFYRCQTQAPVSTLGHAIRVTVTASDTDFKHVSKKNTTKEIRDTEQSVVKQFFLLYSVPIVVILVLSVPVLIKTICRKEYSLRDKDTLTTVFYEEAEDSSLQE
ncbi:uncharacterized protein LOC103040670 [Astyanax mexicanus]|uniref:uncharacterized protein LOC103040670 n=1 Tax=Astyanax mexicanus TaxID=7994 RepID=UPI0020CAC166|nr:uncharacterized protein LOC103040670 [Astyanax mexicanus]